MAGAGVCWPSLPSAGLGLVRTGWRCQNQRRSGEGRKHRLTCEPSISQPPARSCAGNSPLPVSLAVCSLPAVCSSPLSWVPLRNRTVSSTHDSWMDAVPLGGGCILHTGNSRDALSLGLCTVGPYPPPPSPSPHRHHPTTQGPMAASDLVQRSRCINWVKEGSFSTTYKS